MSLDTPASSTSPGLSQPSRRKQILTTAGDVSLTVLETLKEISGFIPIPGIGAAANLGIEIITAIQEVDGNKQELERLEDVVCRLIVTMHKVCQTSVKDAVRNGELPQRPESEQVPLDTSSLSTELQGMLKDLGSTLQEVKAFIDECPKRSRTGRFFLRKTYADDITAQRQKVENTLRNVETLSNLIMHHKIDRLLGLSTEKQSPEVTSKSSPSTSLTGQPGHGHEPIPEAIPRARSVSSQGCTREQGDPEVHNEPHTSRPNQPLPRERFTQSQSRHTPISNYHTPEFSFSFNDRGRYPTGDDSDAYSGGGERSHRRGRSHSPFEPLFDGEDEGYWEPRFDSHYHHPEPASFTENTFLHPPPRMHRRRTAIPQPYMAQACWGNSPPIPVYNNVRGNQTNTTNSGGNTTMVNCGNSYQSTNVGSSFRSKNPFASFTSTK
ncbi:hypothetical protein VNI00_004453 [Paramarasmius palmivorus]|uniref:Fungal N-terminal domain-containing protein n=1 Tax=Paramarasmius palmivorus TaxID=297713 RepID=A0AAW0DJG2_9AGAR